MTQPDEFAADAEGGSPVELEQNPEQGGEPPVEVSQKKPANDLLFKIIVLSIVVVGGGFGLVKLLNVPAPHVRQAQAPSPVQPEQAMAPMPDPSLLKTVASPPPAAAASAPMPASPVMAMPAPIPAPPPAAMMQPPVGVPQMPAIPAEPVEPVEKKPVSADMMMPASPPSVQDKAAPEKASPDAANAEAVATAKIKTLETQISDLKKTIADMQSNIAKTEEEASAEGVKENSAPAPAPKKIAKRKTPRAQGAFPPKSKWVLKAAKPGTAWVAENGSGALRSVSAGDRLPGIGRVLSVMKDSTGHWTLNGTQGRISN